MRRHGLRLTGLALLLAVGSAEAGAPFSAFDEQREQRKHRKRHLQLLKEEAQVSPEKAAEFLSSAEPEANAAVKLLGVTRLPPGAPAGLVEAVESDPDTATEYLNGLGSAGRSWELSSETAFGAKRILTERLEVARALRFPGKMISLVLRVGLGADSDTSSGRYAIQGLTGSLGIRYQTRPGDFSIEVGLTLIPGWAGLQDREPAGQSLALGATLTSSFADDAHWLPLSKVGGQIYLEFQSRTHPFKLPTGKGRRGVTLALGTRYGGQISLAPMVVSTWLGPQYESIANLYAEVFVAVPEVRIPGTENGQVSETKTDKVSLRAQLGVHGDVSLSSIWPGNYPFPMMGNVFAGWSPADWLSFRVFVGCAGSFAAPVPAQMQYGARFVFSLP